MTLKNAQFGKVIGEIWTEDHKYKNVSRKEKGKMLALFDITTRNRLPYNWVDKCWEKRVVAKHAKMPNPIKQHRDADLELNKTQFISI